MNGLGRCGDPPDSVRGGASISFLATAVMLAGLGAWVVWGGRPEPQPVPPLEPASRARERQVIAVHLSASPVHRSQPGRLDSEFRRGEWHCHVPEPSSSRVRDAAIEGLRSVIEQDLATRGNPPAEVPVTLRVDEGVGDDVVSAVQGMLGGLGIADVTTR